MDPIEILEARRAEIDAEMETLVSTAETESRSITDEEQTNLDNLVTEYRSIAKKIQSLTAVAEARAEMGSALEAAGAHPTFAPARTELRTAPYHKEGKLSYWNDLAQVKLGNAEARDRLVENDRHREDKIKERRTGETTVAGAGGEFAPPLWEIDQFVKYLRAGRPLADILNKSVVPHGIQQIALPKIATGTAVATQTTQNTQINVQDITTTSVSTNFTTIAGGALIAQQLLDQSPISMDDVILQDLAADLALKVDIATIAAIAGVSGLNAITYTNASPTSLLLAGFVQQAIDQIHMGTFAPAEAIVMRPDRWGRLIAAGDSTGRPLVVPSASYGLFNAIGQADGQNAQGAAGTFRGVPVFLDASIPANLGAGTNQDEVFVLRPSQINLYESAPKAEAFQQTYANTLSVFCRIYEYFGIIPNRLPKAISVVSGTGMIPGAYGL